MIRLRYLMARYGESAFLFMRFMLMIEAKKELQKYCFILILKNIELVILI